MGLYFTIQLKGLINKLIFQFGIPLYSTHGLTTAVVESHKTRLLCFTFWNNQPRTPYRRFLADRGTAWAKKYVWAAEITWDGSMQIYWPHWLLYEYVCEYVLSQSHMLIPWVKNYHINSSLCFERTSICRPYYKLPVVCGCEQHRHSSILLAEHEGYQQSHGEKTLFASWSHSLI